MNQVERVVIVGGGPAGLTASFELMQAGVSSVVLERDSIVGGLSRTASYKGYRFDIGGHRFFTKIKEVDEFWKRVLEEKFMRVQRLSRIYYKNRFFDYPLRPMNALKNLGVFEACLCMGSYFWAQCFPQKPEDNFERWISNRFGTRLFNTFFKTYTEKVWGIPCDKIQAEWAAQRIKNLSLWKAVYDAFFKPRKKITSLIEEFDYPELGPGQMWETVQTLLEERENHVVLNCNATEWHHNGKAIQKVKSNGQGPERFFEGSHFISSMPIRDLLHRFRPLPPQEILQAADALKYRDFLVVCIIIDNPKLFPDNWIYVHSPEVKVGRIQNFKNWSPKMVADPNKTCLGMEYFCFEGDDLWTSKDEDLIERAKREISILGLADSAQVKDGTVLRMEKAYPVYDPGYQNALKTIREYLSKIENLQLIGRNGMHHYNNQDHSMFTAMLAVRNILGESHDLWKVNTEEQYHEEGSLSKRLVPEKIVSEVQ
jgi:protoporphyrinogen oxidase